MISIRWPVALVRATGTIKFRLALGGVLALALGISLSTALLLARVERDTVLASQIDQRDEALRSARLLGIRVKEAQRMLADTASQLPFQQLGQPEVLRRFLLSKPVVRGAFDSMFIAGIDGQVRLFWDAQGYRAPATYLSDRPYFKAAMASQQSVVSALITSRVTVEPIVVLAYPVVVAGRPVALLAGSLQLRQRDLASAFTEADGSTSADQLVVVTDGAGRILAHPLAARIGDAVETLPRLQDAVLLWRHHGRPAAAAGLTLDDPSALVAVANVPGADWLVWRWRSRASVLAPLAASRADAVFSAALLSAAMGASLLLLLGWQLRPLAQLQQRAQHLFDGSLPPHAGWPSASGEIGALVQVLRHVGTERAQLECANAEVMLRLQSVMAAAPVGIALTREGRFELVSREFCRLLQRDESALLGLPAQLIYASNEDYLALGPLVGRAFAAGQAFDGELQFLRGDGSRFPGRLRGLPVELGHAAAGTIWTLTDITDEVVARQSLEWAAHHDTLTGLANRNAFDVRLAQVFAAMPQAYPAALLVLDLDRFKPINDSHGHAAGDAVLRAVAAAIQTGVRGGDLVARLGGDEFAVLLERCPAGIALRLAEAIRAAVAGLRVSWHGHSLGVGASVGVAPWTAEMTESAGWLAAADQACYGAKAAGRNRIEAAGHLRLVDSATIAVRG
jgi:diguanylate cyclase (GGDEF)-like protein